MNLSTAIDQNSDFSDNLDSLQIGYWNDRARGYSLVTRMTLNDRHNMYRKEIMRHIKTARPLKVLDLGTGAGLLAIMMAELGHEVKAIDYSDRMIHQAEVNAKKHNVVVDFSVCSIESMESSKESFDLIISKGVFWCLQDPVRAYSICKELLKPGGRLLIMDGNYYLDLFDEDYAKRREFLDLKEGKEAGIHYRTNMDGVDVDRIRRIAEELPLSRVRRPMWDVELLVGIGMKNVSVSILDKNPYRVLDDRGLMLLPYTFSIYAELPADVRADTSDEDFVNRGVDSSVLTILKLLGDETRMRILASIMSEPKSVNRISQDVGQSKSLVSHNLKVLRESNIVRGERQGKEMLYRVMDPMKVEILIDLCSYLAEDSVQSSE